MKKKTMAYLVDRVVDYLLDRTTWMAFGSAGLLIISYVKPEWVTLASGLLSIFGLVIKDRKK